MTQNEFDALESAIKSAESRTDGELVTVVTDHCDGTAQDTILIAALAALCFPALFIMLFGGSVGLVYTLQMLVFFVVYALFEYVPDLQYKLLPAAIKQERVRRHALAQFHVQGLHKTQRRLGVMVFVSMAEQRVEILADSGYDNQVNAVAWQRVVTALVARVQRGELHEGFMDAIAACAEIMEQSAPTTGHQDNELTDRLIVLG